MEDKSNDDEGKESPSSPQMGGKKLKLNDGTPQETQDSAKPPAAATTSKDSKDENFDSGISVDKSESTSSDDKVASTSNNVVHMALPREGISAFFEMSRRSRKNYRKRKTPDRDSDSNASSRDSDDLSPEELAQERVNEASNSDTESDDLPRFVDLCSSESNVNTSGSNNSSDSEVSYESDILRMHSGDTDTDDEPPWVHSTDENDDNDEDNPNKSPTPALKPQPKHNFTILREIINRETGLTFPPGRTVKEDVMFERRFYGSLHAVYRLKKLHSLNKHKGCVNAINFHPEGHLLVSGSDDTNVIVWNWAKNIALQTIKTGHKSNVFQSKFLYLNAESQLNIVTCARDGQVRLVQCGPSGGAASRRKLASHGRAAHKLHVSAHEPHVVLSAGEDGLVLQSDVRTDQTNRLFQVKDRGSTIPLYSIHAHPLEPKELIVAGRDKFIRMYDRRKSTKPIAQYCPGSFINKNNGNTLETRLSLTHLTCAVYNHDGTEILGSYNDENIYLFDPIQDAYDKDKPVTKSEESYIHRYTGHRNSATFKGVAFFGPKSEYVVSGSDCSYIYIWDKNTEAIVQWMQGDVQGVVNCVEAHPRFPILATSGLDKDVKIWLPKAYEDPKFEGLERVIRNNSKAGFQSPLFNDFLPTLYDALHEQMITERPDRDAEIMRLPFTPRTFGGNIDFDGNGCTTF